MLLSDKQKKMLRLILIVLAAVSAGLLAKQNYEWHQNEAKIPAAIRGKYVVFSNELDYSATIDKIDATEEHIYVLYDGFGVVAVYDWSGEYQYSMVFFTDTNGVMGMRCDNGLLCISDNETYEYVFSGDELVQKYEPTDKTYKHSAAWFKEAAEPRYVLKENALYTQSGERVMVLPGQLG